MRSCIVKTTDEIRSSVADILAAVAASSGESNYLAAAVISAGSYEHCDTLLARLKEAEVVEGNDDQLLSLCLAVCDYRH